MGRTARNAVITGGMAVGIGAWLLAPRSLIDARRNRVPALPRVWYAHRGLHDAGSGMAVGTVAERCAYVDFARECAFRAGYGDESVEGPVAPENSLASFAAACEAGYGIELDIQLSRDGRVVVVHDIDLMRVAGDPRRVKDLTYAELCDIPLFPAPARPGDCKAAPVNVGEPVSGASSRMQHVPLLSDVLELVAGRVPLIIEYKFAGEAWDESCIDLMERSAAVLDAYDGAYAVESFHPMAVKWYRDKRPGVIRGQLADTASLCRNGWQEWMRGLLAFNWLGRPDFVAYGCRGGDNAQVRFARKLGATTVSWTVRSGGELERCDPYFDCHIFESFIPAVY